MREERKGVYIYVRTTTETFDYPYDGNNTVVAVIYRGLQ
jgi:hypothetical protein